MVLFISGRLWSLIYAAFVNHIFGIFRNCNIEFNGNEHTLTIISRIISIPHVIQIVLLKYFWNFVGSVDGLTEYFAHLNTLECVIILSF